MPSGRASSASHLPRLMTLVTALGAPACADGTLPPRRADDPANPAAAEAPSSVPAALPAAPSASAAPLHVHHHGAP
ncbi:MAG TPA: hypothetical protein VKU41_27230 [Polyangiaceae bacterium]|nr:hypothetical protein [Polyangiaceae bacterium]